MLKKIFSLIMIAGVAMCNLYAADDEDEEEIEEWDLDISKSMAAGAIHFSLKAGKREEKPTEKKDNYNPYDTHWESSFDWKDEDNDGYDDRDDGFWQEREF